MLLLLLLLRKLQGFQEPGSETYVFFPLSHSKECKAITSLLFLFLCLLKS